MAVLGLVTGPGGEAIGKGYSMSQGEIELLQNEAEGIKQNFETQAQAKQDKVSEINDLLNRGKIGSDERSADLMKQLEEKFPGIAEKVDSKN